MLGVGAVGSPMPPVAVVYQSRFVPVAVSAGATVFWQYGGIGLVVGAAL